jgi:hypothetical protein
VSEIVHLLTLPPCAAVRKVSGRPGEEPAMDRPACAWLVKQTTSGNCREKAPPKRGQSLGWISTARLPACAAVRKHHSGRIGRRSPSVNNRRHEGEPLICGEG